MEGGEEGVLQRRVLGRLGEVAVHLACERGRGDARAAATSSACARRNWHGARATRSVYGWLRSHVIEAAGARSS